MRRILFGLVIVLSLLLLACSSPAQVATAPTAVPAQAEPATATSVPSATPAPPTPTIAPTNTPAPTDTPPPTNTPAPTNTSVPTDTATPADTPVPTGEPTISPNAVVKLATLNVRAGPGAGYAVIAAAKQGDELVILGQAQNCGWLKIKTPQGREGWVAAGAQYVTFELACSAIPQAAIPPTPVPLTAAPPTAAPAPPAAPIATAQPETGLPTDQGCYLIENFLGAELTFTITARDWNWADTFKIPSMGQHAMCLGQGRYTYTIDAPPPWASTNGYLDAVAGQHYRFPVRAEQ